MDRPGNSLIGLWIAPDGPFQINADGTAIVGGMMFQYMADGRIFTLTGTQGSQQFPYRLTGDTMTYVINGQTFVAHRLSNAARAELAKAMQVGAGVWVGNESSLDPSLYISWTQYLVLNPDNTVDYGRSDSGAQVSGYNQQFLSYHEASPSQTHAGRWQGDGMNVMVQWNNGAVWQGQADIARGQLVFFGIGALNSGSNVVFKRQPVPFSLQEPSPEEKPQSISRRPRKSPAVQDPTSVQPSSELEGTLSKLFASLEALQKSGRLDPDMDAQLGALIGNPQQYAELMNNPQLVDALTKQLEEAGANEIGSGAPLQIADYYREGQGSYTLKWPLEDSMALPVPFNKLDRKTQFFVLFNAWTQREMQGMYALNSGQVDEAEQIFQECLARADQIDVSELRARSYEGLMRVAQTRGDPQAEHQWIQAAQQARAS